MDENEGGINGVEKKKNGPILMHIYDKQCGIVQIVEEYKLPDSEFFYNAGMSGDLCQKHGKLGKLKRLFLKIFKYFKTLQGCTMSKGMPRAFRICMIFA